MTETYEEPYLYEVGNGDSEILTVGNLKKVLENFKDNDRISIFGDGDKDFEIKALWNASTELEMTGNDPGDNVCFIKID